MVIVKQFTYVIASGKFLLCWLEFSFAVWSADCCTL